MDGLHWKLPDNYRCGCKGFRRYQDSDSVVIIMNYNTFYILRWSIGIRCFNRDCVSCYRHCLLYYTIGTVATIQSLAFKLIRSGRNVLIICLAFLMLTDTRPRGRLAAHCMGASCRTLYGGVLPHTVWGRLAAHCMGASCRTLYGGVLPHTVWGRLAPVDMT